MKNYLLLGMLALVLAIVVIQSFQISAISERITGNAAAVSTDSGGAVDTSGWTDDELMNYEMHGIIPARVKGSAAAPVKQGGSQGAVVQQAPAMVGGC